jgi:alkylation response protein AidB-like acyl-CoA dehydrogenase
MDFAWSSHQRELLDAVGRFATQQLDYNVIENDRDGVFNQDAWKKCGNFGIQGLLVPTDYGGLGMDLLNSATYTPSTRTRVKIDETRIRDEVILLC